MKKIILFSFLMLASVAMTSCTADSVSDVKQTNSADIGGGQNGQLPPPPPPK
jgi:hypothetical protein